MLRARTGAGRRGGVLRTRTGRGRDAWLLRVTVATSVHALGAAQLVAWGTTFYALPPLLPHVAAELEVSPAALAVAMTAGLAANAVLALGVAAWIRATGARAVMTTGSLVAAAALAGLAAAGGLGGAAVALVLLGAAQAALLYEPAFAAVAAQVREPRARTRAIHVITFWGGWAALWAVPATFGLEAALGWRGALVVLAGVLAVATLPVHARLPVVRAGAARRRGPAAPIARSLAGAFALGAFATTAIVVHAVVVLAERAVPIATVSVVLALVAPMQVLGRLWFLRRGGELARGDAPLPFVLVAGGIAALVAAPHALGLVGFTVLFGAGAGLVTTIRATVVVACARPEHVAHQLGTVSFVTSLARAGAPAAASGLHAALGGTATLLVLAALALVAAALVRATTSTCTMAVNACCAADRGSRPAA